VVRMATEDRERRMRYEKGKGLLRAVHESELDAAGAARALALHEAEQQLDRIARRLRDALAAGLTVSEIARLTGVSRPTLYELRARYSADPRDLTFAVISVIGSRAGSIDASGVVAVLKRPAKEIGPLVRDLIDQDVVREDFNEKPDDPMMELFLTEKAFDLLEAWEFPQADDEPDGQR